MQILSFRRGGVKYHLQIVDFAERITNLSEGVYLSGWKYLRSVEEGPRSFVSYFRNASGMDNMSRRVTLYDDFWQPSGSEVVELSRNDRFGADDRHFVRGISPVVRFVRQKVTF